MIGEEILEIVFVVFWVLFGVVLVVGEFDFALGRKC